MRTKEALLEEAKAEADKAREDVFKRKVHELTKYRDRHLVNAADYQESLDKLQP